MSYGSLSSSDWLDRLLGKRDEPCVLLDLEEAAGLPGRLRHGARIRIPPGAPLFLFI